MKLFHTDEDSLTALGVQASEMLARKEYSELASRFGYALCYGREPGKAIEADYQQALASPCEAGTKKPIVVKYFKPNSTQLFAVVECWVPANSCRAVLMSLIVAGTDDKHITIEDINGEIA